VGRLGSLLAVSLGVLGALLFARPQSQVQAAAAVPIKHVVVIYQENHSFNEMLGFLCVKDARCEGTHTGMLHTGDVVELARPPDLVPGVQHTVKAQQKSTHGGLMDGFSTIHGCTAVRGFACYQQYRAFQIRNLASLARAFTISDHTFEMGAVSSWGSHLELVAAQLDGFAGDNPVEVTGNSEGLGWGCDSFRDALWRATPSSRAILVPSCIPRPDGTGPYRSSPVQYVPTIMDRLDAAGLPWRIYRPTADEGPKLQYGWAICPTFAECLYGPQAASVVPDTQVLDDAAAGDLPSLSIVIPQGRNSQHNGWSIRMGDNWIGSVVDSIMQGPDWGSTAIFITYDDCGCFYDEVPPPAGLGIRVPMVIVSPYAKPVFTDTHVASFASMLAFTERVFGLQPLSNADANAYDYLQAFDFTQQPLAPVELRSRPVPEWEKAWLRAHPPNSDVT
jgi:phospholipase C